MLYVTEV